MINDLKDKAMRLQMYTLLFGAVFLTACSLTQKPALVSGGDEIPPQSAITPQPVEKVAEPVKPITHSEVAAPKQAHPLSVLVGIAKLAQKNPQSAKSYAGEILKGQGKFVKAPKGNPNAVVADVRVAGLGEVSLWCRNIVGAVSTGKLMSFEGVLTGSVYISEDFSHDVTMKDCRFHE